jgi:F-type H+-transporting ATPase subunit b
VGVHLEWAKLIESLNWTFVFNLANFALLLYVLKRLLFKPALAYLDRRRELIASRMERARRDEEHAAKLVREGEEALAAAQEKSQRVLEEASARREEILATAKADAEREAKRLLGEARREIGQERAQMEEGLRRTYAEIAVLGAARVLRREVNLEDHRRLLDELLEAIDEGALKVEK